MKKYDFLIVGAGFSGAVIAERIKNILKKSVLVVDKRNHIGGNCYDYFNEKGVLVHKYGPHYFNTDDDEVIEYLSRFTDWIMTDIKVKSYVNGKLYSIPVNRETLNLFFGVDLKTEKEAEDFLNTKKINILNPANSEEQVLSQAGKEIYEAFFKNYTIKQWGIHPKELDPSVSGRIPVRFNNDTRYHNSKFQAMPKHGYFNLFSNMLKGIPILLNTDFGEIKNYIEFENLIFTGRIDEFFKFKYGKLPYRSLKFISEHYKKEFYQEYPQINYPNDFDYTRSIEIKHVTLQKHPHTTVVKEIPTWDGEPYYPVPQKDNILLNSKYQDEEKKLDKVFFIGRLAKYQYINMDQAVKESLELFKIISG